MKIAFVGKGGSGKTTLSALLARVLSSAGFSILAIDADINQHLASTLGLSPQEALLVPSMGLEINRIKRYLRDENPRIKNDHSMIKTTPPGSGSRLLKMNESNPIFDYFSREVAGVCIMAVGLFDESDLGIRCYHSKTGSVELLLNHLIDKKGEYVIVDMTAGADSFSSGLFTRFDYTFLIVEPTLKSVSVYEQYKKYAKDHDVTIKVIGNKIENENDVHFLKNIIGEDLIACFSLSSSVKKSEQRGHLDLSQIEDRDKQVLQKIVKEIDSVQKDWKKFYKQAVEFHLKNAKSWGNEATGQDLAQQIDPTFDFIDAISA